MQLDANLSLKKAKIRTHQREAVAEQQQVLNSPNALIWYSLIWSQYSQITTKPNNSLVAVWLWNAVWCGTAGVVNNLDSIHLRCGQQRRAAASRRPTANHAHAVAKANIPVTNVPQKEHPVTNAKGKGTTVHNASPSRSQSDQQKSPRHCLPGHCLMRWSNWKPAQPEASLRHSYRSNLM